MKSLSITVAVLSWVVLVYVIYRIVADRCIDIPVCVEMPS